MKTTLKTRTQNLNYEKMDRKLELIEDLKQKLSIVKQAGDGYEEASVYCNLGNTYQDMGDFKQAIEYHKLHLSIAKEVGNRAGEGAAYGNLGNAYDGLGDFKQAIEYHKLHQSIAKETGNRDGEGGAYGNLGNAYDSLGDFKQAIEYHKLHLSIAKETGDRAGEGGAYGNLGNAYRSLGDFKQAIEYHKLYLGIAKEIGDRAGEGRAYGNLGNAYRSLGDFKQAIEYHKLRLSIAKETGDRAGEGRAYGNLGNAYRSLGDYKQAIEYHKLDLSIAKETGDRAGEGRAYGNLGNAYDSLGDFKQATEYHKLHLSIAKETGDRAGEGCAYGNLGIAYDSLGDFKQAIEYHKLHLSIAKETGDRPVEGCAYGNLGNAYRNLGDFKQAIEYHNLHLNIAKETGDRAGEGRSYGNLGNAYRNLGDFKQAIEYHKLHLSIAKETGDRAGEGRAYGNLGNAYHSLGDFEQATDYYRSSVEVFDKMRALLQSEDMWKIGFRDFYRAAYTALYRTLVKVGETEQALCAAEHGRAQALRDILEKQYGIDALPSTSVEPKEIISYMLNALTTQTVFVALSEKTISFWVLTQGSEVRFKQTVMERDSVTSLIESALKAIGAGVGVRCENRSLDDLSDDPPSNREACEGVVQSSTSSASSLRPLYDTIIGPIADFLEDDKLIIVPDGPLCLVPYSALSESIRIRTVPSLTALKLITASPDDFHSRSGALLVGDPFLKEVTNEEGEPLLVQLPYARKEVEMIGKLLKTKPLTGRFSTKEEVLKRMRSVALVHIAAHGCDQTGEIALAPNPGRPDPIPTSEDYILTMSDVQAVRLRARLVVLSCCHSGRGEIKAEGVVGLARAFLCAGARSVLVSLWAIDDEATMLFMKIFYQQLADGKSASVALHQAMKSLRQSEQFGAAKYWASFVLIGDDVTLDFGEQKST